MINLADLFLTAQEQAATNIADNLLSGARHLRINQLTPFGIKLHDTDAVHDMAERGAKVGEDLFTPVRSRFLEGYYAPD